MLNGLLFESSVYTLCYEQHRNVALTATPAWCLLIAGALYMLVVEILTRLYSHDYKGEPVDSEDVAVYFFGLMQ